MRTFNAEGYEVREIVLHGFPVRIASVLLDQAWSCRIDNVSPGATIARGSGPTREAAEQDALTRATERIKRTRRIPRDDR
ncbi:MAG: hypothetical protein H6719_31965 [Sandaracinaceae bacterium]|nr:hypothetical protein [Sandaracinaceae bacterium]